MDAKGVGVALIVRNRLLCKFSDLTLDVLPFFPEVEGSSALSKPTHPAFTSRISFNGSGSDAALSPLKTDGDC